MICTIASGSRKVNGKNECVLLPGPKTPPVFRQSGEQVSPPKFQPKGLTLEGMDMRITNDVTTRSRGGEGGRSPPGVVLVVVSHNLMVRKAPEPAYTICSFSTSAGNTVMLAILTKPVPSESSVRGISTVVKSASLTFCQEKVDPVWVPVRARNLPMF